MMLLLLVLYVNLLPATCQLCTLVCNTDGGEVCRGTCVPVTEPDADRKCDSASGAKEQCQDPTEEKCVKNACLPVSPPATCINNIFSTACTPSGGQVCANGMCITPVSDAACRCNPFTEVCYTGCVRDSILACDPGCDPNSEHCVQACVVPNVVQASTATPRVALPSPTRRPQQARLRCQNPDGSFLPTATVCDDADPIQCSAIFNARIQPRDPKCDTAILHTTALSCARTCKICCERPEHSCNDQGGLAAHCNSFRAFCNDPTWQQVLTTTCAATCGLCGAASSASACNDVVDNCALFVSSPAVCREPDYGPFLQQNCAKTCNMCNGAGGNLAVGGGQDLSPDCARNRHLCNNRSYRDVMTKNCCQTCNRCSSSSSSDGGAPSIASNCVDASSNCALWNSQGFCSRPLYTSEYKRQFCARTCNLC